MQSGAELILADVRLSANRDCALMVDGLGTRVGAKRLLVDSTQPRLSDSRFGRGVSVQTEANFFADVARLLGNREAALSVGTSSIVVVGSVIEATLPRESDQTGGSGLWLAIGSSAALLACLLKHNLGVALGAENSALQARGLVIAQTSWGDYKWLAVSKRVLKTTNADGIALSSAANSVIDQCLVFGSERAGIVVESSPGVKITHTLINGSKGLYGLVFQHTLDAIDQFNAVFGASVQDRAVDAGLSLPAPPEPVEALSAPGKSP